MNTQIGTQLTDASESRRPQWMRLDIQGLRAIAVLLVVTYHSGIPLPGGFTGVDVFFVISGYVITGLILRQLSSPAGFRMRTFYVRRMRRLIPALALMTTVVVAVAVFVESPFGPQRTTALTGIGASFFMANFVIYANTGGYFDAPAELNPLLHTWSLSVEEQFYFVFPALMLVFWALATRFQRASKVTLLLLLGFAAGVSFVLSLGMGFGWIEISGLVNDQSWAFYSSVTRAWEFAVGSLLAVVFVLFGKALSRVSGEILSLLGLGAVILGAFVISTTVVFPGVVALVPVLGAAAIIAGGTGNESTLVARLLSSRPLVFIGALSYSWYLWHWPAIVFTRQLSDGDSTALIVAGLGSLIPAWLSYRFIENPIRTSHVLVGRKALIVVASAILVPALASWGLLTGSQRAWGSPAINSMTEQIAPVPVSFTRGCDNGVPLGQQEGLDCTWHSEATGTSVYLVGDSQAGQFAEATIDSTLQLDRPLTIATAGSCPFITTLPNEEPLSTPECEGFVQESITWLAGQPPATVVIGMSGNYVTAEYAEALSIRLARSIDLLTRQGHEVNLLQVLPQFPEWSPYSCTVFDSLVSSQGCGVSVTRIDMDQRQSLALDLFEQVSKQTNSRLIDLRDNVCTPRACGTNDGDRWIFRDPFHITVDQSTRLTGQMLENLSD